MPKKRRGNNEGSIYRPTYTAKGRKVESRVWWIAYRVNGEKRRESSKSTKKAEAQNLLALRLGQVLTGGAAMHLRKERVPFERLCELIDADYMKKGNRLKTLRGPLKHLRAAFVNHPATAIEEAEIDAYATKRLRAGAATATVNRELATLRRMMRLGRRARFIERIPEFEMLGEDNVRKGFMEREVFDKIREHLPEHIRPVVDVAYITGWRKGELLSRSWRHVDFDAGWLRLEPGEAKSKEPRMFPLTAYLRRVLEEQKRRKLQVERATGKIIDSVFFYYRHYGHGAVAGAGIREFRDAWETACQKAGYPDQLVHDFRRTAARNLIRAGVPESIAMQYTGHKTAAVFRRYGIVNETMLKNEAHKLAALHDREIGQSLGKDAAGQ